LNGHKFHYLDWGGQGPTILWLSGLGNTPYLFTELVDEFTPSYHCLGFSRRGHGYSDSAGSYELDSLVSDISSFIREMKLGKVILAGHSFAGVEMTRLTQLHPEQVSALVYLDAAEDWRSFEELAALDPVNIGPDSLDMVSFERSKRWFMKSFGIWSRGIEEECRRFNVQRDGSVKLNVLPAAATTAMLGIMKTFKPDYSAINKPVLSFFAVSEEHWFIDATNSDTRKKAETFWKEHFVPDRLRSIEMMKEQKPDAKIISMDTQHLCFIKYNDRKIIKDATLDFLNSLFPDPGSEGYK
jgi:pimeloyl-ACP methyl ester carboxylesterase